MGKPTGFKEHEREMPLKRPVAERVQDYKEFYEPFSEQKIKNQAARCMDCGVPFCHSGCPLGNIIPDWNDLVYRGLWREAIDRLHATNNFPEFTGRLCPAPCEEACVLGITDPPVTIEHIEKTIVETAWENGWITSNPPATRTGKTVAVVGSGPAGLAAAEQLNRAGHTVTVLERADRIGGLLRYGIPDFKMEKHVIDRRLAVMEADGITFQTQANVGVDYPVDKLDDFDAVVLSGGATLPRDLPIPGRDLDGVHYAMAFLAQQNKRGAGDAEPSAPIRADGKHVIVIGGGDTGSDCIGTSNRHGAASVTNFEIFPEPSTDRPEGQPWPYWPMRLRTSSSHEEGCDRQFAIMTKQFRGENGKVKELVTVRVEFVPDPDGGRPQLQEIAGSEISFPADLVLLAMGFLGPEPDGMIAQLELDLDPRGNIACDDNYMSSKPGVFSAGDMRRGQSLIVWAISEGRECARCVDSYLTNGSELPTKGEGDLPRR
jgi:glutamate synthase (NADPH/NADH) small chain